MRGFLLAVVLLVPLYGYLGEGVLHKPVPGGTGSSDLEEEGPLTSSRTVPECLKQSNVKRILRELHDMTDHIKVSVPDKIRHQRLLPKSLPGIALLKEILDFYAKDVFSKMSPGNKMLMDLHRLRNDVEVCARRISNSLTPVQIEILENIKRNFTELKADGLPKAVGEFKTVLLRVEYYLNPRGEGHHPKKLS